LKGAVKNESSRYIKPEGKKEETETLYYITGSGGNAEKTGKAIRSHWRIENSLHRVPDVSFREDESRKKEGCPARNFSVINRIAFNLIKNEQSKKRSMKGKDRMPDGIIIIY
jgi:predicted transposase YbfD/YdcC